MSDSAELLIEREADIVAARQKGREIAAAIGFSSTEQTFIAMGISEIARNILVYAKRGSVAITEIEELGRRGVRIVATDHGPGIPDIALAMRDGYSTNKSLGLGLPGTKRLMDEFVIESEVGVGTRVTMQKWRRR